jgi:hypothetical protein
LYYASGNNTYLDLNKYVVFVPNVSSLTTATGAHGDIYYCEAENVLATKTSSNKWVQINANTDTTTTSIE